MFRYFPLLLRSRFCFISIHSPLPLSLPPSLSLFPPSCKSRPARVDLIGVIKPINQILSAPLRLVADAMLPGGDLKGKREGGMEGGRDGGMEGERRGDYRIIIQISAISSSATN
ncbi:hypothetical protein E2C01_093210 [Portunus trituberculatus]|uniref:Uncharacterized protein n=1 Tax=Portunus trituberculatus TaxID=210409 RepID=A0A5B7JP69_PORTR|nr:hypothetical protein [Portunus trituberculatus]